MRPITSPILQQNNNNNYPCLSAEGPGTLPPKCSHPAVPLPTRPELGLAGLPLIRGLRAWALCSRSRQRPGGPLGQAPMAPPSCPRPADVHLSAQWGLPLGLDARRAGIGALVATLQTAEGSGRTQTQCLFLRTDRGSCLYPTSKPVPLGTTPGPGGVLRGWLRSKTGGAQVPPSHTGPNKAKERSGRRWRKSANSTAGHEKARTRQQRQEEPHKGGSSCGQDAQQKCPRSWQNASSQICTPKQLRDQSRGELRDQPREGLRDQSRDQPREELRDQSRDQPREELRDQSRDQPREELRDQSRDQPREELRDQSRDQPREGLRDQPREGLRDQSRDQPREELRDQPREELRDQPREELRDQPREELRDQPREELRDQPREELRDQPREELREELRDQPREELRDQPREELRDQSREELRDRSREELRDRSREELRDQSREELRDQPREELRDQSREELRDQPREDIRDQSIKELRDQSIKELRDQSKDQSGEELRDQSGKELRDQSGEELRDQPREELRDQPREELRDQCRDQSREELRDQSGEELRDQPRQELRDQSKDQSREELRDQSGEDLRDQSKEELRDQSGKELRDQPREELRDQPREELRDQRRDQSREELRDQSGEELRDQPRQELREEPRVQSREELREEPRVQSREELREEPRVQSREELREQSREAEELEPDHQEDLLFVIKPDMESYVRASILELETKIIHAPEMPHDTTWKCSKLPGNTNWAESVTAIAGGFSDRVEANDTLVEGECLVCCLCHSDCVHSSAPVEGSICNANSKEADPFAVSQFYKCKSQKFNSEHRIVDKNKGGPSFVSNVEKNSMEACYLVRCGGSFANHFFSTFSTDKHSELPTEADNKIVNSFADTESVDFAVSDCESCLESKMCYQKQSKKVEAGCTDPLLTLSPPDKPASPLTAPSCNSVEVTEQERGLGELWTGHTEDRGPHPKLDEQEQVEQKGPSLDPESEDLLEDQEFGVFMQAPSFWSHENTNHKWGHCSTVGTPSSLEQLSDSWAVFPLDGTDNRRDDGGQWWPHSSVEDRGPTQGATLSPVSVFTAAFPSPPALSSCAPCDSTVPTLTQLLRGCQGHKGGCPDQGLLDTFHDLNKMIGQRYKRASGVSQELLLQTLSLEPPVPGSRVAPSAAHRRLSPGLPSPGLPSPGLPSPGLPSPGLPAAGTRTDSGLV